MLILVNKNHKVKKKHKILLKLTFIDNINTRKYIQYKQERIVRKDIIINNNHLQLHKKKLDNI